jgi:hypothetical protein
MFKELDPDKSYEPTTLGVWMSSNKAGNILVFDVEGTDCAKRGDKLLVSLLICLNF